MVVLLVLDRDGKECNHMVKFPFAMLHFNNCSLRPAFRRDIFCSEYEIVSNTMV